MKKRLFIIFVPIIFVIWLISKWGVVTPKTHATIDFDSIMSRGKLVVAINTNKTDYFLYNGEPKGFQFELLQQLGNYLGVKVEVIVNDKPEDNIALLKNGECDLIASSMNYSSTENRIVSFSDPILETKLVLVQRKPSDLLVNSQKEPDTLIRNVNDLNRISIYVPIQSGESFSIKQLSEKFGGKLKVYEMAQFSQEKLIESVASGEIDYTVCNNILALSLKNLYPELDFETVVKTNEPIVWNFRKATPVLAQKINQWIFEIKGSSYFAMLIDKYFNNRGAWFPADYAYNPASSGKISAYDSYIKKYSQYINWDWRLLAALIYQESRFKPDVKSRRGAWGLMQMMPVTQTYFGIDTSASPEKQILAGVKYIKFLDNAFAKRIPDPQERVHFILASYNIGPGHIFDAQKLAEKAGKNPLKWFNNVDSCLLSKSEPQNYSDPDIQFGYCKGTETYNYVQAVVNRYHHYKNVLNKL